MQEAGCDDLSNELLPWYLNGSLETAEAEQVRSHVGTCAVCSRELDDLASIAGALAARGDASTQADALPGATIRRHALRFGLAAGLAVVVAALILWLQGGRRPGSQPPAEPIQVVSIDLGAGPTRGQAAPPSLLLSDEMAQVDILFAPPVNPEATYEVEIRNPDGQVTSLGPRGSLAVDPTARARYRVEVKSLSLSGDYVLHLREFAVDGEVHEYSYPFRVIAPAQP